MTCIPATCSILYTVVLWLHISFCSDSMSQLASPVVTPLDTAIARYANHLRKMYLRTKFPSEGKWPPFPCKKIINLAMIERVQQPHNQMSLMKLSSIDQYMIENKATSISMENLFLAKDGSPPKAVVVQGAPGIGKSTFAWKFCRRWAKGKIYQQYCLVVLLRMRDTRIREAKTLTDLFSSLNPFNFDLCESVAKEVASSGGRGVIILFEGLDELPSSLLRNDHSLLNEILGGFLPEVTAVITSRPWAIQKLAYVGRFGQFTRLVEILGFTKEDVLRFVSYAFDSEEKDKFLEYLHSHPQLESIMHIPLNAASIVEIYKQFKRAHKAIPQTLTQLYTALVKSLLLRYMTSIPEFSENRLEDLNSLPELIRNQFQQLCLLAFMSFTKVNVQVTFTNSETALYGCLDSLGLMQSSADLSIDTGTTVTHSFLHFTIQEFLAAYHLAHEPDEVQKLFVEVNHLDAQFELLIGFLIGLNPKTLMHVNTPELYDNQNIDCAHLRWLFESQSPEMVCGCLGNNTVKYFPSNPSPFHHYAMTYCVCYSNCKWKVTVDMSFLTAVFSPVEEKDVSTYSGQIEALEVFNTTMTGVQQLEHFPQRVFTRLQTFSAICIHSSAFSALAKLLRCGTFPQLKNLFINFSLVGSDCSSVVEVVEALDISLNKFSVYSCSFSPESILSLCACVSSHICMSSLTLPNSAFNGNSLQLLISALPCTKSLHFLDLTGSNILLSDIELLAAALSANTSLNYLNVSSCFLDGLGAEALASSLEENQTLKELIVSYNNIDKAGARALSSMLRVNTSLELLDLRGNTAIGTIGAVSLINALDQNKSLKKLFLPSSCEPTGFRSVYMYMEQDSAKERVIFLSA